MAHAVFVLGASVGGLLIGLLVLGLAGGPIRIWPTPGAKTWQSYVFWPLFRGLNVLCVGMAALDTGGYLSLPAWLRAIAFAGLVVSTAIFIYAFRVLGRDNSYGARDGLVTDGIYQWTRNPQNAMLVVVYGCLAVAVDGAATYVLCAAMMAVYVLMVLAEEPWLEGVYGAPYRSYCASVPRFFNWRRAAAAARAALGGGRREGG